MIQNIIMLVGNLFLTLKLVNYKVLELKIVHILVKDSGGKPVAGQGKLNFLESKYKEPKKIKTFDFGRYSDSVTTST